MERYSLDKRISSCMVDKDLIKEIEVYLNDRLSRKVKGVLSIDDKSKYSYSVIIEDSLGEERLASIDDYHRDKFPNDIKVVILDYDVDYRYIKIRLKFSKEIITSYLTIEISCEGAKELALGIKSEIERILSDNETIHYIFYGIYTLAAWVVVMIAPSARHWLQFSYSDQVWSFLFILGVAYFLIRLISPYTSFDTKRKEKRDKFISWFLNGMAGVFVFGVMAFYLRDQLL